MLFSLWADQPSSVHRMDFEGGGTTELAFTIQYWLLIVFNVIPRPAWATLLWASRMTRSTTKLFFGRIMGCFKFGKLLWFMKSATDTHNTILIKTGFRQNNALDLLISAFLAFVTWCSSLESPRWIFCKALTIMVSSVLKGCWYSGSSRV